MDVDSLEAGFLEKFGKSDEAIHVFFAPGRVNMIGEHTDYNEGYVFPCALDYGTYLMARKTGDSTLRLATTNFNYAPEIPLDKLKEKHEGEWVNFPLGVIDQLKNKGLQMEGLEMMFSGDIPNGAGLSSSASIELVTAVALNELFSLGISQLELVKLSQKAENEFVGMNCGIMDQFAVGMGAKNKAIFLDCETLDYELVPFEVKGFKIVISNTNLQRKLTDSQYNERRSQCEKALEYLNQGGGSYKNLGKIRPEEFEEIQERIPDPLVCKRARHVITEDERVLKATRALKDNDLLLFGQLMNASHESLKNDYEVTGFELDTLAEEARKIDGVLGSRMTGAGFGGCTVSLVKDESVDEFVERVGKEYEKKTGIKPDFYIANIGDGAKKLETR